MMSAISPAMMQDDAQTRAQADASEERNDESRSKKIAAIFHVEDERACGAPVLRQ